MRVVAICREVAQNISNVHFSIILPNPTQPPYIIFTRHKTPLMSVEELNVKFLPLHILNVTYDVSIFEKFVGLNSDSLLRNDLPCLPFHSNVYIQIADRKCPVAATPLWTRV